MTHEEFLERSYLRHPDTTGKHPGRYNYPGQYKRGHTRIAIECRIHGNFLQAPSNHIYGQGCPVCAGRRKLTRDEFIRRSNIKHNGIYCYDLVEYKNVRTKVIIHFKTRKQIKNKISYD